MTGEKSTRPRQMWELQEQRERRLSTRSIWARGAGLSRKASDVLTLLQDIGPVQRVRVSTHSSPGAQWGKHIVYATFKSVEAAELALLRLDNIVFNSSKLRVWMASDDGAYRPMPKAVEERLRKARERREEQLSERRMHRVPVKLPAIAQHASSSSIKEIDLKKLERIRKLNEELRNKNSPNARKKDESSPSRMPASSSSKTRHREKREEGASTREALAHSSKDKKYSQIEPTREGGGGRGRSNEGGRGRDAEERRRTEAPRHGHASSSTRDARTKSSGSNYSSARQRDRGERSERSTDKRRSERHERLRSPSYERIDSEDDIRTSDYSRPFQPEDFEPDALLPPA